MRFRWLLFCWLLSLCCPPPEADASGFLFETGRGPAESSGTIVDDDGWVMHRFRVDYATQLQSIGGAFQNFGGSSTTLFGAVVELDGPTDFPDMNDLSSADLLGSTTFSVAPTGLDAVDASASVDFAVEPGWYGVVFGAGAFGAPATTGANIVMPEFAIDSANSQSPVSLLQPGHPTSPNGRIIQLSDPRFFATAAAPGPQTVVLNPSADGLLELVDGDFQVDSTGSSIGVQKLDFAGIDRRGVLEFAAGDVPRGSTVTNAALGISVAFAPTSPDSTEPVFYGYRGDGVVAAQDAMRTDRLVSDDAAISGTGPRTVELDTAFFADAAGPDEFFGLLIEGGADGSGFGFRSSETGVPDSKPTLTLEFTPPPSPLPERGDYNGDGYPGVADYTVWRDSLGTTNPRADGNNDGIVDVLDYQVWVDAYRERPSEGVRNGGFATGDLGQWRPVLSENGEVEPGFPLVESFDVDGDGDADEAIKIRGGQEDFDFFGPPGGGGVEQRLLLLEEGDYTLSADIAATNEDIGGNGSPGRFELLLNGVLVDAVDLNEQSIQPGEVLRGSLSGTLLDLGPGRHTLQLLYLREAINSREVFGYFDNIAITRVPPPFAGAAVPEPGSAAAALLAAGILLAGRSRAPFLV